MTKLLLSGHIRPRQLCFLDAASAELFGDGETTAMTEIFFPSQLFDRMKLFVEKGKCMS